VIVKPGTLFCQSRNNWKRQDREPGKVALLMLVLEFFGSTDSC
jgi:hypothetical protein